MTDPNKEYHLEFNISRIKLASEFLSVLNEINLNMKTLTRNSTQLIYCKESETIEDCLGKIGATKSFFVLMETRAMKQVKNKINRRTNFEAANLSRTIEAGMAQIELIEHILSKIKGFGQDVLNGIKAFFGIHSPSKVMEEQVGKNLALGVAQGITKNADKVDEAAEEMGSKILKAAEQTLKEYKRIHKMSISEEVAYWAEIVKQTKKGTQARIDAEDKYYEALEEQQRQIQEAEEEAARKREEQLEQYKKELEEFQEAHRSFVEQVMDQTDLFDPFKISDSGVTGADLIANLQSQVDGLINYAEIMDSLEDKLSGTALLEKLKEFGTDSLAELQAIKERMKDKIVLREGAGDVRVVVGMATCGIAAGARPVLNAFVDEVAKRNLKGVTVSQTGCIGMCQYEPIVEVIQPGKEKVTYVKMTADKVAKVVNDHIVNGNPVAEYTVK